MTRYDNLKRLVERLENDPANYPHHKSLIEELRKAASGGKRYRKLYNRARAAVRKKSPEEVARRQRTAEECQRREREKERRTRLQGLHSATPREATGRPLTGATHTVSGGLPGAKR